MNGSVPTGQTTALRMLNLVESESEGVDAQSLITAIEEMLPTMR